MRVLKRPASLACRRLGPSEAVDVTEADAFGVVVMQDLDGVAVEDRDDMAGEVGGVSRGRP